MPKLKIRAVRGLALAVGALLSLAACQTPPAVGKGVAAAEIALTEAENLGIAYKRLPACQGTARLGCSDPATVERIKAADRTAYGAVMAAKNNEALIGAAWSTIAELTALVPKPAK